MTPVFRILRAAFAAHPFDGEGCFRYGSRWSPPGVRLVFTAEHLSLAMIEYLVHLDPRIPPTDLIQVKAEIPDDLAALQLHRRDLPDNWRQYPAPDSLTRFGADFAEQSRAAILMVPSALVPTEYNWILNPEHPDFTRIRLLRPEPFEYDPRLVKS